MNMQGPIVPVMIIVAALAVTGLALYLHNRFYYKGKPEGDETDAAEQPARPEGCCGMHEVCEKATEAALDEQLYYDDEELDAYRGRPADSYTEAETDAFREVLLTLRRTEILAWDSALQARGIALPTPLRDEMVLLLM